MLYGLLSEPTDRGQQGRQEGRQGGQQARRQPIPTPSGMIVRGLASGIGLVSEAVHHHKTKKSPKCPESNAGSETRPSESGEYQDSISRQMDEANWNLDEAQDTVSQQDPLPPHSVSEEQREQAVDCFLQQHSLPPPAQGASSRLALPVLITQRRPGRRARGFVRAYAPLLNEVGIDQATFLDFIDHLNKATIPSPLIQAVNLASLAAMHQPEPISLAVGISIQLATRAADAIQSRVQTNKFLDKMNRSFFAPRGLVSLVMTWKPSRPADPVVTVEFDTQKTVATAATKQTNGIFKKLRGSNGTTYFDWPETAPLIFPLLDDAAEKEAEGGQVQKESSLKRSSRFVQEYFDKRARAKWAGQNPDSKMANSGPKDEFYSRYSDPNHPASSGDPLALLTGGYLQDPLRNALMGGGMMRGNGGTVNAILPLIEGVTRPFQHDTLYLLIAQRPTEGQIAEAAAYLN